MKTIKWVWLEVQIAAWYALAGFGTFRTRVRKARKARNPRTGATVTVRERLVVSFKATPGMTALVSDFLSRADVDG